jgi:transcriptional regulator with XRE-family HTH domain
MFLVVDKFTFAEWLQREMNDRGLSQSDLGRLAGLNRAVISKIINQTSKPTPETVETIARALKLPPEEVFRAAGLLPAIPDDQSKITELNYLLNMLDDDDLRELIKFARFRLEDKEKKQTSRGKRPARNALKGQ